MNSLADFSDTQNPNYTKFSSSIFFIFCWLLYINTYAANIEKMQFLFIFLKVALSLKGHEKSTKSYYSPLAKVTWRGEQLFALNGNTTTAYSLRLRGGGAALRTKR